MAYQCLRCNSYTADGQKHDCIYDEVAALSAKLEIARVALEEIQSDKANLALEMQFIASEALNALGRGENG